MGRRKPFNIYRDGFVHVMSKRCSTCIYGAHSPVDKPRREEVAGSAIDAESTIICHKTLGTGENAACRGFFDLTPTQPLQVASRLGLVRFQDERDRPS